MIHIRRAMPSDLAEIIRLNKSLFDFEDQFGHCYNLNWPYEEAGQTYFKERLQNESALVFVAEVNEKIIGYILAYIKTYPYRKPNPICEIENMFVDEEYRDQGVGKSLMETVKTIALERDVKRLRVGAIAQNEKALRFYRVNGFGDSNLYLEMELRK